MARPSKLTAAQCEKARTLRAEGIPVPKLAKRFKVSESSMYKVMDGSYVARTDKSANPADDTTPAPALSLVREPVPGATPSIFKHPMRRRSDHPAPKHLHPTMAQLKRAAELDGGEIDELTLAAAELIVAKANYARTLAHMH